MRGANFLRWFFCVCLFILLAGLIFISATPKEIVAKIEVPSDLKAEISNFDFVPVQPWVIKVNYKSEDRIINITEVDLPFWQSLCYIESVEVKELRQGGRELLFTIETVTSRFLLTMAIFFSLLVLIVFHGLLKPWIK